MSIAVLRTFVSKRKEEHEALLNKKNKSHKKSNQIETSVVNGDAALTSQHDKMDVVNEKEPNQATNEIEDASKEAKTPSWKVTRELKPPVVLEVRHILHTYKRCRIYFFVKF
jgi:tRNA (guanine26-N2/guanine27-N2)-dimethyltransferase